MRDKTQSAIAEHVKQEYPKEACGFIVVKGRKELYVPCENISEDPTEGFRVSREDYKKVMAIGDIKALVHSHPDESSKPSEGDLVMMEEMEIPWVIVSVSKDLLGDGSPMVNDFRLVEPNGYKAPLVGRMFFHGVLDCYSLVRDYFQIKLGITLINPEREDGWWEKRDNPNLYELYYKEAGFEDIKDEPRIHDVILMEILSENGPNHAGVYLGDGKMLHHLHGRPSCIDIYGGYWAQMTRRIIRHKDLRDEQDQDY